MLHLVTTQCAAQHATCTTQPLCNKCKERDRETGIKWAVVENTNHVADLLVRVAYCCWPWESKSENHPYSPSNRFQNTFTAMETEVQRPVKAMCKLFRACWMPGSWQTVSVRTSGGEGPS